MECTYTHIEANHPDNEEEKSFKFPFFLLCKCNAHSHQKHALRAFWRDSVVSLRMNLMMERRGIGMTDAPALPDVTALPFPSLPAQMASLPPGVSLVLLRLEREEKGR